MSNTKIKHQHLIETERAKKDFLLREFQNEAVDLDGLEMVLKEDANIFLLNNLMMSIQFFENYERDVRLLRENWFKEVSLNSDHKKCFNADSLIRLSGTKIKFSPMCRPLESQLHPFRIYVSSDNVEAAYDPSALGRNKLNVWPQYQFTVTTNDKTEKSGCITLVEFKTIEGPTTNLKTKTLKTNFIFHENPNGSFEPNSWQRKSNIEEKYARRLTKTEKSIAFQNKHQNLKLLERCSLKTTTDAEIPAYGFYQFENPEIRLKPKKIQDFRMNALETSHEIPRQCFQCEEVRKKFISRQSGLNGVFRIRKVLNATAFKAYFCDFLIEKLCEGLNLDLKAAAKSEVVEEFIRVNQESVQYCISPVIFIRDWNNFTPFKRFQDRRKLQWPSSYMQEIINMLPCSAVPSWHCRATEENLDYEKTWKLVFPHAEEFLLLHMMHAHIHCYFFVLLIYKSFVETEINRVSFNAKHLLHLLFWKVHKNFLAWPEDRPGETFLHYLKTLYKKLQNKYLSDFFITSRNLFATSLPKDLHKAQTIIKKIIENPIPYLCKAISNLNSEKNFYPTFDISKFYSVLSAYPEKPIKLKKKKKQKTVQFLDEEKLWKKNAIKQIKLEKKVDEQDQIDKLSIEPINLNEILNFCQKDVLKCNETLQMFTSHFVQMGHKSLQYEFLSQAMLYLNQAEKFFQLMANAGTDQNHLRKMKDNIESLKQCCWNKFKTKMPKFPEEKQTQILLEKKSKTVCAEQEKRPVNKQELLPLDVAATKSDNKNTDEIITIKL